MQICQRDGRFAAGQGFEQFVRFVHIGAAQDGLIRLGEDFGVVDDVLVHEVAVGADFAQAFGGPFAADDHVTERHAQVAQHGTAGQIALEARDGQFARKEFEQGAGDAQVALGVFEVDGIDLVGHGRRADFACFGALYQVAVRHIAPQVLVHVGQDGADPPHRVADFGQRVVGLDLGRQHQWLEVERADECTGKYHPIDIGHGDRVRGQCAGGAGQFARQWDAVEGVAGTLQTRQNNGHFFAEGRRCGDLAMRTGRHDGVCLVEAEGVQVVHHFADGG